MKSTKEEKVEKPERTIDDMHREAEDLMSMYNAHKNLTDEERKKLSDYVNNEMGE